MIPPTCSAPLEAWQGSAYAEDAQLHPKPCSDFSAFAWSLTRLLPTQTCAEDFANPAWNFPVRRTLLCPLASATRCHAATLAPAARCHIDPQSPFEPMIRNSVSDIQLQQIFSNAVVAIIWDSELLVFQSFSCYYKQTISNRISADQIQSAKQYQCSSCFQTFRKSVGYLMQRPLHFHQYHDLYVFILRYRQHLTKGFLGEYSLAHFSRTHSQWKQFIQCSHHTHQLWSQFTFQHTLLCKTQLTKKHRMNSFWTSESSARNYSGKCWRTWCTGSYIDPILH